MQDFCKILLRLEKSVFGKSLISAYNSFCYVSYEEGGRVGVGGGCLFEFEWKGESCGV